MGEVYPGFARAGDNSSHSVAMQRDRSWACKCTSGCDAQSLRHRCKSQNSQMRVVLGALDTKDVSNLAVCRPILVPRTYKPSGDQQLHAKHARVILWPIGMAVAARFRNLKTGETQRL